MDDSLLGKSFHAAFPGSPAASGRENEHELSIVNFGQRGSQTEPLTELPTGKIASSAISPDFHLSIVWHLSVCA